MDTRPQGFLGRAFTQAHPELNLPPHLAHWRDDHILLALVNAGEDLFGNLLVGSASLDRYLDLPLGRSSAMQVTDPLQDSPRLAQLALGSAAQGRVGMVSLEMYDAHSIGIGSKIGPNWAATAMQTGRAGAEKLSAADIHTLCLLDAFGALIANTDRHHGNVSLLLHQHRWQLAPAYDMLPMFYAPVAAEVVERDWASQLPRPNAETLAVWPQARELALRFWQIVAEDVRISAEFRELARVNWGLVPQA